MPLIFFQTQNWRNSQIKCKLKMVILDRGTTVSPILLSTFSGSIASKNKLKKLLHKRFELTAILIMVLDIQVPIQANSLFILLK